MQVRVGAMASSGITAAQGRKAQAADVEALDLAPVKKSLDGCSPMGLQR